MAWIYLIIAAALETAWTFCVKFMEFSALKNLRWATVFLPSVGLPVVVPFVGYVVFGVGNVYFFSLAIKSLPTATAYAAWTAATLVLIKLTETFFMKQRTTFAEVFFMLMIMTGILGMKYYATAK
ncbi:MAG TPA: SMR family transporter [Mucilaginibacter sp.]|jgi:quaternary ammonium compound-resistance protein SugE|nr:SMR family transporter [Mucilaginibacter sp.]